MTTMTETSPLRSPARSPMPSMRSPPSSEAPKESVVSRLFIAPITLISFLISLALIDEQNHLQRLRTHQHSTPRPPPGNLYQHIKRLLHDLVFKPVHSSPNAYVRSPDAKVSPRREDERDRVREERWHWHTKQRHMMAAEIEDAFRIRKWVVVFLFVAFVGALGALGVFWRWVSRWERYAYLTAAKVGIHDAREI